MKQLLLYIAIFTCGNIAAQPAKFKQLDSILNELNTKEQFSGVVLIAEKGKPVFEKAVGFRDIALQQPLQLTDIFELASVSKQFTAMIVLMLAEEGKLKLEDAVEQYLAIPYKGITIKHLLTHTSGLPDYQQIMDQYWDKSKVAGNDDILLYLNKYAPPALFAPGEKYDYSNTGYVLLASIAEKASGKDFTAMCREKIFRKLKMKDTDLRSPDEKATIPNFAIGHIYVPSKDAYIRADAFPSSNYTIWLGKREGPGRISATARDLLKWSNVLYTGKLVSKASLEKAFTPMQLNNGSFSNYGFGWDIEPASSRGKVVMHNGDNPGYKTQIIRYLDTRTTIILLNNNAHAKFNWLLAQIRKAVEQ